MPKSIAGAYAIAGTAIAIAIIVVTGSTVGLFGSRQAATGAEAAAQAVLTPSSPALDVAAVAAESSPGGAAEFGPRGEREHEEREHAERARVEGGFLAALHKDDD